MTTKRLALLLAVLLGGMSLVYMLPHQLGYQPMGINLALPEVIDGWVGTKMDASEKEHEVLGFDTQFARMEYLDTHGQRVLVSIVLAGQDMMTGLHRPERCLLAQGWNPGGSTGLHVAVPGWGNLPVTRLNNSRKVQAGPGAPFVNLPMICYYYFVGASDVVASHGQRVWVDTVDRLTKGYNQRWAMILVSGEIMHALVANGRDEEQTDQALQNVIRQITPQMIKEGVRPR